MRQQKPALTRGGFLPGVPAERLSKRGCCLGMGDHHSEAPTLSGAFRKGRGCVRPVSREQPHAAFQRWRQRRVPMRVSIPTICLLRRSRIAGTMNGTVEDLTDKVREGWPPSGSKTGGVDEREAQTNPIRIP
jgi:hypothetical protein